MTQQPPKEHDLLDQKLARALRGIPLGRPLPQPKTSEPTDDELLLLFEGGLEGAERARVEALVRDSAFSTDRLDILREALADADEMAQEQSRLSPDEEPAGVARLVFSIAKGALSFLRGTDAPMVLMPAAMATRGGSHRPKEDQNYYCFERRFADCETLVQVENLDAGVEVRVRLSSGAGPLKDGRATLRRGGKLMESVKIRDGVAGFAKLPPDRYEIELTRPQGSLGRLLLDFLPL